MLEQLSIFLGFPFKLVITGLIAGLIIIAKNQEDSLFQKITYVITCVFASGYAEQFLKMFGYKMIEGTSIMWAFSISVSSKYFVGGLVKIGSKFESDPIKFIKQYFKTKAK